jgi:transposase-like protein
VRYPASEKAEIIKPVEQSHLSAKRTLDKLGIPRATFYRWYDRFREGGIEVLADHRSRPDRVWDRIPDDVRSQIIDLVLELPELSPREPAARFDRRVRHEADRRERGARVERELAIERRGGREAHMVDQQGAAVRRRAHGCRRPPPCSRL